MIISLFKDKWMDEKRTQKMPRYVTFQFIFFQLIGLFLLLIMLSRTLYVHRR